MELDRVISGRLKLVRVKVLHDTFLPARANGLLTSLATSEDLNVHHVVLLLPALFVEVDTAVED